VHGSDLLRNLRLCGLISAGYTAARFLVQAHSMRVWLCLVAFAACSRTTLPEDNLGVSDGGAFGGSAQCMADNDCVAAAPTCCECPTFALPKSDPLSAACGNVACPEETCPANVQPACDNGRCELACVPMTCPASCASGYAMDASGCLTCTCAPLVADGCQGNGECVEVPADCCGCAHGGVDTAVLASDVDAHQAGLMCPPSPQCPSVNTCEPAASPQCIQGQCALSTGVLPANACGRADLAACPAGQNCVVNSDPAATLEGVGVCVTP
jgi:Antistasin family